MVTVASCQAITIASILKHPVLCDGTAVTINATININCAKNLTAIFVSKSGAFEWD